MNHLTWIPAFMSTWFYEKGLVYYRDFVQLHFPLPHLIAYPYLKFTNWDIVKEPFLAYFIAILTTVVIYKVSEKYLSSFGRIASLAFFSLMFWYSSTWVQFSGESVAGLFLLITVFFVLKRENPFLIGISFSLTELTGQIVTPTLVALFALYTFQVLKTSRKNAPKIITRFLLGTLIPIATAVFYFWLKGAAKDFFFWNITYYLTYAKLAKQSASMLPWKDILFLFSPTVILVLSIARKRVKDKLTLALVIATASSIPFVVGSIFHPHHYLFILPVAAVAFGKAIETDRSKLVALYFFYILIFTFFPWYSYRLTRGPAKQNLNDVTADPTVKELVSQIKNRSSQKGITVVGDPLIYYFSDTLPANKYFMALPWHYIPLETTKKAFEEKPPQLWIIDTAYMRRFYESWKTPEVGDFIKNQVESCYQKVYESEPWEIWERVCPEN